MGKNLDKVINEAAYITLYNEGKVIADLSSIFGVNGRSLERYEQKLRFKNKIKPRVELQGKSLTAFKKEYQTVYSEMLTNLRTELQGVKAYTVKSSSRKVGDTLVIQLSDWHIGRIIEDEDGTVVYNEKIFREKIDRFCSELLKLVDKYISKATRITNVVIISTGDILDGMGIFASQEVVSELSPPFQVMIGAEVIQKLILAFLDRKLTVQFKGVRGNHGEIRTGGGKAKDPNANWDLMLYLILDLWAKTILKSKSVDIQYSKTHYMNFDVRGWKYHARHIAPQQSETAAGKGKFLGWARKHGFDVLVYGHYHHWGAWDRSKIQVIRGGALTAGDEFAETLAEDAEPIQLVWGCNEHRPLTFLYPIDLGRKEKKLITNV